MTQRIVQFIFYTALLVTILYVLHLLGAGAEVLFGINNIN